MVDLQDKPSNFTSLYARSCGNERTRAKVPVLEVGDDQVLIESLVICEYLDDVRGGGSALGKARARLFQSLCAPSLSFVNILKADAGSEAEAAAVETLHAGLRDMDAFLRQHGDADGPFLSGDTFGLLAEATLAPFVQRCVYVLPGIRAGIDPLAFMEAEGLSRLAAWTRAVCARESCIDTLPPKEELIESYGKLIERMKAMTTAAPA